MESGSEQSCAFSDGVGRNSSSRDPSEGPSVKDFASSIMKKERSQYYRLDKRDAERKKN